MREGSLEAPQRHSLDWQSTEFNDDKSLFTELERVFDICHGCRRCFNLCNSFPTLFDAIDESDSMEIDTVDRNKFWEVVDNCYLCDLCFMTKCPYVPPHEWQVDFPSLMLRSKIVGNRMGRPILRDKLLSSTDSLGKLGSLPGNSDLVNAVNRNSQFRVVLDNVLGIHRDANLPKFCSNSHYRKLASHKPLDTSAVISGATKGQVALFVTCYGKYNNPSMNEDLIAVFEHNRIPVQVIEGDVCCGMPKLEIGDMNTLVKFKKKNIPILSKLAREGWDIVTPIPSCTLMFRQHFSLLFSDDDDVKIVQDSVFDPFEYLMLRYKHGTLSTNFRKTLGTVVYHAACHQRVQNFGDKTSQALSLVPDTKLTVVQRCSGHNGTYAVKKEFHEFSMKIVKPIVKQVDKVKPDHLASDCVLAAAHIAHGVGNDSVKPQHPITLLRIAYGI